MKLIYLIDVSGRYPVVLGDYAVFCIYFYPLVNGYIAMEKTPCPMGKLTTSMAMFESKL